VLASRSYDCFYLGGPLLLGSIPGIAEMFHVVSEAFITLLHDSFQGLSCRWMLVHALKVPNEHDT
jgi:hypothetical protein